MIAPRSQQELNRAFLEAVEARDFSRMQLLYDAGADIDDKIHACRTSAMRYAALNQDLKAVEWMLARDADPDDSHDADLPLTLVLEGGESLAVAAALLAKTDWSKNTIKKSKALFRAMEKGHEDFAVKMIEAGAPIDADPEDHRAFELAPLYQAAVRDQVKVLEALRLKGQSLDTLYITWDGEQRLNIMYDAARFGRLKALKYLRKQGVSMDDCGTHPIFIALNRGQHDVVCWMLDKADVDIEQTSPRGDITLLGYTLGQNNTTATKILLERGADLGRVQGNRSWEQFIDSLPTPDTNCKRVNQEILTTHRARLGELAAQAGLMYAQHDLNMPMLDPKLRLWDKKGKATALLYQILGTQNLQTLFNEHHWKGQAPKALLLLEKLHEVLPEGSHYRLNNRVDVSWARRVVQENRADPSMADRWARRDDTTTKWCL